MVLKGQECLLTRDLIVTSTLRFGGCRIYYKMKYLYDIYSHDCLPVATGITVRTVTSMSKETAPVPFCIATQHAYHD